jgi:Na+/citrate or Na+/malate symporter
VNAINRFFLAAMTAAVLYFLGEFIGTTFLGGHAILQLVVAGLFAIIHIPAVPFIVLFPSMSPTLRLFIACLGWGALVELSHVIQQRVRARRLTRA